MSMNANSRHNLRKIKCDEVRKEFLTGGIFTNGIHFLNPAGENSRIEKKLPIEERELFRH